MYVRPTRVSCMMRKKATFPAGLLMFQCFPYPHGVGLVAVAIGIKSPHLSHMGPNTQSW